MSDERRSKPAYWKRRYLVAIGFFLGCVIWQICSLGSQTLSAVPALPTCVAIFVLVVLVVMLAKDPKIRLFDQAGNLDKETSTKLKDGGAKLFAPLRQFASCTIQNVSLLVQRFATWIENRDVSVPYSFWRRISAILGFWFGAAALTVPLMWYALDGTAPFRLVWGCFAAACISCADLIAGGSGWRPDTNRGLGGMLQFKQFWPSIVRHARTFTRGFTGGIATTVLYGYTIAALFFIGQGFRDSPNGPPGTYPRGGKSAGYVSPAMLGQREHEEGGDSTGAYWKTAIADLIADRFPEPVQGETVREFHLAVIHGLEQSIQRAEALDDESVDRRLIALTEQLVEVDRELLAVFREVENITVERGLAGESVDANEAVLQGAELSDSLAGGTISTTLLAETWGVPNELVQMMFALDQRRAQQWDEIVEMQSCLKAAYPSQPFDLPE